MEIARKSKVWACHDCWTVFHLSCIKKWSSNNDSTETSNGSRWRCPGCNLPQDVLPSAYLCWCGKEVEPRAPTGIPPHSCGQTCGRQRAKKCPHACDLTCHAGPCPPCPFMGPTQACFCGKHQFTKRCSETDYYGGWACGDVCGKKLSCGDHSCAALCHDGTCEPCAGRVPAKCYCGHASKDILCSERSDPRESRRETASGVESWIGTFNCGQVCGRLFDCGKHRCQKRCHSQTSIPSYCPRSPNVITHCPCGKTPLKSLTDTPRETCSDPIPNCSKPCKKKLPCGHECPEICHTGPCVLCMRTVEVKCRCGRTTNEIICHEGQVDQPRCDRVCRTLMSCGRHNCEQRCCTGESQARERLKRKSRAFGNAARALDNDFEAEHICTRPCGRQLKCGSHVCQELCHKGACPTCREAIFDEISCHCGRTVLQPPLPCGTKVPHCSHPCRRRKPCGHTQTAHNCHSDDEGCPKCAFLVPKSCMCGKQVLPNQPCWLPSARCGNQCDKTLSCGYHRCRRLCHSPGDCEDSKNSKCTQPCGKQKRICGHPDTKPCHAPFPCNESDPCTSKITITCSCDSLKQEIKCNASVQTPSNFSKTLPCTDECARLERRRKLAAALNIDPATHIEGGNHIPYSNDTMDLYTSQPKFSETQEREFRVFAADAAEKRLRFKPMKRQERAFIHSLAEDFGFEAESMDPEPHRHVMIWKTARFVAAPSKTVAEAVRIRTLQDAGVLSDQQKQQAAIPPGEKGYVGEDWNAFLLEEPRFALTINEICEAVGTEGWGFEVSCLPSGAFVIKTEGRSANEVGALAPVLEERVDAAGLGRLRVCVVDKKTGELVSSTSPSAFKPAAEFASAMQGRMKGWSQVAGRKAAQGSGAVSETEAEAEKEKVTFRKRGERKVVDWEKVEDDWTDVEV
ncbi:hypothetical protein K470DRAFT_254841 [Piedraia hortae CBS 480.64]|uniref:R3H domain-containing protein n=1 Tax=Piedraia hortae CBS 480.64 TaxID=1314780 RepID=A0A6A7C7J1_9PEZI|nr:hypothetical protein K470DRAFT_254841 [Piedraia hortae CBS 480.64]